MNSLSCPRCNQKAFGIVSKLKLSPRKSASCDSCRVMLTVPWLSYLAVSALSGLLPFLIVMPVWYAVEHRSTDILALICIGGTTLSVLLTLWLHFQVVPLVARSV